MFYDVLRKKSSRVRHFAYVQVADEDQNLWQEYSLVRATQSHFAMEMILSLRQIYPVFRDLFRKTTQEA